MKKLIIRIIGLCLLVAVASMSAVAQHEKGDDIQLQLDKLGVKTIEKIPEGIEPIVVKDNQEMLKYINSLIESKTSINDLNENLVSEEDFATKSSTLNLIKRSTSKQVGFGNINLYATIQQIGTGGLNSIIIGAQNMYTTFTGYTLGYDWRESQSPTYSIDSRKKSIHIWVNGEIDVYLLVDGLVKLFTYEAQLDINYNVPLNPQ